MSSPMQSNTSNQTEGTMPKDPKKIAPEPVEETTHQAGDASSKIPSHQNVREADHVIAKGKEVREREDVEKVIEKGDGTAGATPASNFDHDDNLGNEDGLTTGHVPSETASKHSPASMVDQAGDLIDSESTGDKLEHVGNPKSASPFDVQDNHNTIDATGGVIGELTEGTPQKLGETSVREIDAEGKLKAATGSTIGEGVGHTGIHEVEGDLVNELRLKNIVPIEDASGLASPLRNPELSQAGSMAGSKITDAPQKLGGTESLPNSKIWSPSSQQEKLSETGSTSEKLKIGSQAPNVDGAANEITSELPGPQAGFKVHSRPLKQEHISEAGSVAHSKDNFTQEKLDTSSSVPGSDFEGEPKLTDLSILKDKKVNKLGKIVDESGIPFGKLIHGDIKEVTGRRVDVEGKIWDDSGHVIGNAEVLPDADRNTQPSAPFDDFPDSALDGQGKVIFEGRIVGKLVIGDAKELEGKRIDADGDVLDKNGNTLGHAERYQEQEVRVETEDLSLLEGKKVTKAGFVVDDNGQVFGKMTVGEVSKVVGRKVGVNGQIFSESGKVVGTAELIPVDERDEALESPFEDFRDSIIDKHGNILFEGQIVGRLIEGDPRKLVGKKIDADGDVLDKLGNILGKAERWTGEDALEPEDVEIDMSALAGKRVNKLGNLVDSHGYIYGRLVSGDPKRLTDKMSDKKGNIWDEGGNIVGKAEMVPESEREGQKEGPFASFIPAMVAKDGNISDKNGHVIGRLIEGDPKKLYGKSVDADGDVLDKNGNRIGKAERWEPEEKKKLQSSVEGRIVNKQGEVFDFSGNLIAKLTEGDVTKCAGLEIDCDGDVHNQKNQLVGHVTLVKDIPVESETEEEKESRRQKETDKKLAIQMTRCLLDCLDKINPILKMITEAIDVAEQQPKDEVDEQKLVDKVRPLLEQGGQILSEANGIIRGLDPDGRIVSHAKHAYSATAEEHRLAEVLKELTGSVTHTIEHAKRKIASMPHARKELNPLWGLLAEPLGQILAAVGLLLAGVLGLVGRLLSGLGLGGLLDNLLGGLGLKGILKGLGLGMVTESLTGRK